MKMKTVITDVLPKDCGGCEIYLETPQLTVCGATKRATCGGYGRPEWCPLMTAKQYGTQVWDAVIEKWDDLLTRNIEEKK